MFLTFKFQKTLGISLIIMGLIFLFIFLIFFMPGRSTETEAVSESMGVLVIDPGHGGIDSGAVSVSGVKESDINLAIALRLRDISEFCGIRTVMTRVDDSISQNMNSYSEREELIRRTDMANGTPGSCLISIHQNIFPTSVPSGSQVLYGNTEGSSRWGIITHNNLIDYLNKENRRVAEPASKELYITSNANCPVILTECGFLSNFSDLEKLCDKSYQTAFAAVLAGSYLQFKNSYI